MTSAPWRRSSRAPSVAPHVDWTRTSASVLTSEWIDGVSVRDAAAIAAAGHDPKQVAVWAQLADAYVSSAAKKTGPEFDATIVLVLTSSPMPVDIQAAYRLHANAYLVKPSGLEKLELMVQAIKDFWFFQNQPSVSA